MKAIKTAVIAASVTFLVIVTGGAILGAMGLAGAGTLGATLTVSFAVSSAILTGVGTLIASGVGMMTSRGINATGQNFGTKVAARDAQAPRQIVYGECRVGGTIVKITTSGTSNYKLHLAIALAGHEIQSLEEIYYNDELLTVTSSTVSGETVYTANNTSLTNSENENAFAGNSLVRYTFHDGSQTAVDGVAYAAVPTDYPTTCKFQGIAYVYMEVVYDPEKNAGLPNLWFTVKGKKVYDPRTASTAYSNNPALIIRDYLSDTLYGLKAQSSEINDTNASGGFYSSADICDQTVTLPSGTEKRYTANGFTSASASGDGLLEGLLSSCSGAITYTNGQFNLFVGGDRTATLTVTDEDLLGPVSISTRGSSGDLYNVVKSIFVDSTAKYEAMESPVYEDATFLAADTPSGESNANYKRILEMQLPFTSTNTMAQRLHTIGLIRQRQTASISLLTTVEYLKLQPSDWVKVTNTRLGYNEKTFEVISTTLDFLENDGIIFAATRLNLQEIDDTVYDYDAADYLAPVAGGTNPNGGSKAIEAPLNLAISQINAQEGTVAKISVRVSWTNRDDNAIQGTEIQYRLPTDAADDWKAAAFAGRGVPTVVFAGAVVGDQYYVRVRHFSFDNVVSGWTSPVNIIIAEPDVITAPTSVSASTGKLGFIEIGFVSPAVDSVSSINIYFSTSSGFTPSASNLLTSLAVNKGNIRTHNVGLANGLDYLTVYYFKLTALNNYESESSASAEVSGSFVQVAGPDIVDGTIDVAKFAEGLEPVSLVTSVPTVKSTETIYNTTDSELYSWNGSAYVSVQGATDFSELAGQVQTAQIAVAAVTEAVIATNAITVTKLVDGAIEATKIAAGAITTAKLDAGAITADKIASNAITTAKISAGAVTAATIATFAITSSKIAANTITAGQIATGAITADELAANAVSVGKLISNTSKTYGNFKFEMGTSTTLYGFQGAAIFTTSATSGFGVGGFANASNSIGVAGQNQDNSQFAWGGYFANSTGGLFSYNRSETGLCNNTTAAFFRNATAGGSGGTQVNSATICNSTFALLTAGDVHVEGDITASGTITPFTGMHDGLLADAVFPEIGDILIDSELLIKRNVANALFLMDISSVPNTSAIGIYAGTRSSSYVPVAAQSPYVEKEPGQENLPTIDPLYAPDFVGRKTIISNSLGEGLVNVCNEGGNIAAGDLIVTSSLSGKGMKQADDILRGYTVAKARESVTFTDASDIRQVACIYLCG